MRQTYLYVPYANLTSHHKGVYCAGANLYNAPTFNIKTVSHDIIVFKSAMKYYLSVHFF